MSFEKQVLYEFNMPYALGWMEIDGQRCIVGATEDHGAIVVSPPPYTSARILVDGPGGCMSLVSHPRLPGELYAIMGCFLGYNFHGGALYRIRASNQSVECEKLVDLPFAHRMEVVERGGEAIMILANLASSKDSPLDWTRPGTVYSLPLGRSAQEPLQVLLPHIHKNHGFLKTKFQGRATVLISGAEGLFSLDLDAPEEWKFARVLPQEVSEIAVFDLDGDGEDELITIEPFHGNVLAVYKKREDQWARVWETELNYGHCVLADTIEGKSSILVSNRAGNKDLLMFQFQTGASAFEDVSRTVVESGVGAANMLIVHQPQGTLIIATNQTQGQLVRYRLEGAADRPHLRGDSWGTEGS